MSDSLAPAPRRESSFVVVAALLANLGIAAAKFAAAFLTGSSAMLSEGIHSLVDTANEGVLMIGVRQSRNPPDPLHQFGHGNALYFWTLVVAVLLFAVGGGIAFYEGITHLFDPHPIENLLANYVVLLISFVLEAASSYVAIRELAEAATEQRFHLLRALLETKDASVLAVIVENTAAMIGLVLAFLGVIAAEVTGDPRFDAVGSLAVGIVLTAVAVFLAAESRALIIGESASGTLVERARNVIESDDAVAAVESLRTMHLGPHHVVLTARVSFHDGGETPIPAAVERVKQRLAAADPLLRDATIEPAAKRRDPG